MRQILTPREVLVQFAGFLSRQKDLFTVHESARLTTLMAMCTRFCAECGIADPFSQSESFRLETRKARHLVSMARQEIEDWKESGALPLLEGVSHGSLVALCDVAEGLCHEIDRLWRAIALENEAVEQALGRALGYGCDMRDVGGVEDDVCVGEHTPVTLAREAAQRIEELEKALVLAGTSLARLRDTLAQESPQLAFIVEVEQRLRKFVLDRSSKDK